MNRLSYALRPYSLIMALAWATSMYWTPIALAEKRVCTRVEAQSAEVVAATASSWAQLKEEFDCYSHCDDGAIAEGFSESISLLLANQWPDIRKLAEMKPQSTFHTFVLKHIDETIPKERLEHIGENARERCPQGLEDLCQEIGEHVNEI